ncbi:hypothetical protein D3C85_1048150 [compost metagenome]
MFIVKFTVCGSDQHIASLCRKDICTWCQDFGFDAVEISRTGTAAQRRVVYVGYQFHVIEWWYREACRTQVTPGLIDDRMGPSSGTGTHRQRIFSRCRCTYSLISQSAINGIAFISRRHDQQYFRIFIDEFIYTEGAKLIFPVYFPSQAEVDDFCTLICRNFQ